MGEGSTRQEQITAQVGIFRDFRTQRPLEPRPGLPIPENEFRGLLIKYSHQAFDELTQVVGLDSAKIEPMKTGSPVVLDPVEKDKMIDHLFSNIGLQEQIDERRKKARDAGLEGLVEMYQAAQKNTVKSGVEIIITGPLISLEFKSTKAISLFLQALSPNAMSFALHLPLSKEEENGENKYNFSKVTYLNFIDLEAEKREYIQEFGPNGIRQHEQWHTVDQVRELVYSLELQSNPRYKTNSLYDQNPQRFKERLAHFLYDPKELLGQLNHLKEMYPELYDYYVGIPLDENQLEFGLLRAQHELSAYIAGCIKEDHPQDITERQATIIALQLIGGYLPFSKITPENITEWAVKNEEGRWVVNEYLIDEPLNHKMDTTKEPSKEWSAVINKYSKRIWYSLSRRQWDNPQRYIQDKQAFLDFFLNRGGYGYDTMIKIQSNLKRSIDSFNGLSQLRGDPYRALFELSLLPISHWDVYTAREQSKLGHKVAP